MKEHNYMLEPVTGNAKYTKLRLDESRSTGQALQKAVVNLDSVTLSLSKVYIFMLSWFWNKYPINVE